MWGGNTQDSTFFGITGAVEIEFMYLREREREREGEGLLMLFCIVYKYRSLLLCIVYKYRSCLCVSDGCRGQVQLTCETREHNILLVGGASCEPAT